MADLKFTNFAVSTIADVGGISSGDTTVNVASGEGALFPSLSAGEYFYAVLVDSSANREVVKVTARSTDAFTIVRAQDNTTARAFSQGDKVELRVVSASLEDLQAIIDGLSTIVDELTATPTEINAVCDDNTATAAEIVKACSGISNPPIAGDSTAGRSVRSGHITIANGTAADSVKIGMASVWNESAVAFVDNIVDGVASGGFSFSEETSSVRLKLLNANITGVPVAILSCNIEFNSTGTNLAVWATISGSDIQIAIYQIPSASNIDLGTLVNSGSIIIKLTYLTDE